MVVLEMEEVLDYAEVHQSLVVVETVVARAAALRVVAGRAPVPHAASKLVLEFESATEAPQVLFERVIERIFRTVQPDDGPRPSLHGREHGQSGGDAYSA